MGGVPNEKAGVPRRELFRGRRAFFTNLSAMGEGPDQGVLISRLVLGGELSERRGGACRGETEAAV